MTIEEVKAYALSHPKEFLKSLNPEEFTFIMDIFERERELRNGEDGVIKHND